MGVFWKIVVGFRNFALAPNSIKQKIPTKKKSQRPPFPPNYERKRGVFSNVVLGFKTLARTSEGLGEMIEGKISAGVDGGWACADTGARTQTDLGDPGSRKVQQIVEDLNKNINILSRNAIKWANKRPNN